MNIEILALCDAATDQAGKLNILGAFDRVGGALPMVLPQCSVALRIRWMRADVGEHRLSISFGDQRGIPLVPPLDSGIHVPEMPPEIDSHAVNMVLNFQRLRVDRAGSYLLTVKVDDFEIASLPLFVQDTTPKEPNPLQSTYN